MDYFSLFENISKDEKIGYLSKSFQNLSLDPELFKNAKTDQQLMEKIIALIENHP